MDNPTPHDTPRMVPLVMRAEDAMRYIGLRRTAFLALAREGTFTRVALVGRQVGYTTASLREWATSRPVIAPNADKTKKVAA